MTHLADINPLLFVPGDRLSREEFIELWEKMPDLKFAELIDGVVYMPSPLSSEHGDRDHLAQRWIGRYEDHTPVCRASANSSWLMRDSMPQPDLALRILTAFGGRTTVLGGLNDGVPELIVEICGTSRVIDLGPKLSLYERAGVDEYVALLVSEQRVEWRILTAGSYRLLRSDEGVFRSRVFPGLWLDEAAFWHYDLQRLYAVLDKGLRSEEHATFLKERMRT
jgi:hypothetical protein